MPAVFFGVQRKRSKGVTVLALTAYLHPSRRHRRGVVSAVWLLTCKKNDLIIFVVCVDCPSTVVTTRCIRRRLRCYFQPLRRLWVTRMAMMCKIFRAPRRRPLTAARPHLHPRWLRFQAPPPACRCVRSFLCGENDRVVCHAAVSCERSRGALGAMRGVRVPGRRGSDGALYFYASFDA